MEQGAKKEILLYDRLFMDRRNTRADTHTFMSTHMHTDLHTLEHACIYMCLCPCIHAHTHTDACTHMQETSTHLRKEPITEQSPTTVNFCWVTNKKTHEGFTYRNKDD